MCSFLKLFRFSITLLVLFILLRFLREFQHTQSLYRQKYVNIYTINSSSSTEQTVLKEKRPFIILFWTDTWHAVDVEEFFESLHGCGEEFKITSNRTYYDQADVVIFDYHELNEGLRNGTAKMPAYRNPDAPWILATQESPIRTKPLETNIYDGSFNLTWGYRNNADINIKFEEMYEKYEKPDANWIYGSEFSFQFLKTKTKLAAWVVSNCNVTASKRDVFVKELAKHGVTVDIFGKCGQPFKGRGIDGNWRESDCFEELGNQYKFYMSMENSLCLDYITEKSEHGWAHNMVPIIYAVGNKDQASPPGSYIDALEFGRMEDLAKYIKFLDSNPREYFKFFEWRSMYNISSSFHSRAHCYAWEKMRDLTEKLRLADDDVRNKYVGRNLEVWRSFFYNREFNMYCRNCLTSSQVNITHPKQNMLTLYGNSQCVGNDSLQELQVEVETWY